MMGRDGYSSSSFQVAEEEEHEEKDYAWPPRQQRARAAAGGYMRMEKGGCSSSSSSSRPRAVTVLVWSRDGFCSRLAPASRGVRRVGRRVVLALWRRVKWLSGRLLRRGGGRRRRRDLRVGSSGGASSSSRRSSLEWPGKAAKVKPSFWSVDKEHRWPVQGW